MSRTHNVGIVTAYGAAVRGGYTGTYEQFCAQQAQYAENARQMEQAVSDVRDIKTSVESAVSEAEGHANDAEQSATNASNSATSASNSANDASQSAESASQSADNASNSADEASQSATSAQTSANNASTSEQNAHQSAEDAHQSAEDAAGVLSNVYTKSEIDSTIKQKLINAFPTDIISGDVASFNDGADDIPVKSLTVDIKPIQDLHGYDRPWIAGTGKNLFNKNSFLSFKGYFDNNAKKVVSSSAHTIVYMPCEPDTYYTASRLKTVSNERFALGYASVPPSNGSAIIGMTAVEAPSGAVGSVIKKTVKTTEDAAYLLVWAWWDGSVNAKDSLQIEIGSEATDYEPYENICPISGWTGCEVVQTGKNIFGGEIFADAVKAVGDKVQIDKDEKTFTFTRSKKNEDDLYFGIVKPIKVKVITVIITYINNAGNNCLRIRYSDGTTSSIDLANSNNQKTTIAVTSNPSKNVESITLTYYSAGATKVYYDESGVFEGTVTIEDFVPYQGNTLDIDWTNEAGEVFGGTLNVTTGVLTKTHIFSELPLSGWSISGVNFWHNQSGMSLSTPAKIGYCSHYPCNTDMSGNKVIIFGKSGFSTVSRFIIRDNTFASVSDLEAYLLAQKEAGTPVTVAYPLATPRTYQLTPQEVKTILGDNNIFADTGDVSVEYRADIKKYIDKIVATAISALS